MHIQTTATDVRVTHRMTGNIPKQTDLFIEVDDLKGTPVAAFTSGFKAATWLRDNGFTYVPGSQGLWSKRKAGGGLSLGQETSTDAEEVLAEIKRHGRKQSDRDHHDLFDFNSGIMDRLQDGDDVTVSPLSERTQHENRDKNRDAWQQYQQQRTL